MKNSQKIQCVLCAFFMLALVYDHADCQLVLSPTSRLNKEQINKLNGQKIQIGKEAFHVFDQEALMEKSLVILNNYKLPLATMESVSLEEACEFLTLAVRDFYAQLSESEVLFKIRCDEQIAKKKIRLVGKNLLLKDIIKSMADQTKSSVDCCRSRGDFCGNTCNI